MGGARHLLRKLSRAGNASTFYQSQLPRPSAAFSSGSHEHQCLPYSRQALLLHTSDNDEEDRHGSPLSGMPKWLSSAMVSLEDRDFLKFVPRKEVATFSADSSASTSTSIYGQCPALSILSQIRAGGARGPLFCNRYAPMQGVSMVRFSSTATSRHLEDELGNTPGVGGQTEVFSVENADAAAKLVTPEAQAISEVSAIIGDCSYPTAFLQLLMENVHLHAGLPWWAAIAITTVGIRLLCLPIVVYQLKSAVKLSLMRPEMERINAKMTESNYDPKIAEEGRARIIALFAKHKTTPLSPFLGAVLQAPVFMCFYFAIKNMTDRVESFKDGGFLWFTDLTTPDSTFILPILLSASVLLTIELNAAEGMEGNPFADKMKNYMRIFAVVLFPISMTFEKALFCYWLASNYFSLVQSTLFKNPVVKDYLKIPSTAHLAAGGPSTLAVSLNEVVPDEPVSSHTRTKTTKILGRKKLKGSRRR